MNVQVASIALSRPSKGQKTSESCGLLKGKKNQDGSTKLKARVVMVEAKIDNSSNKGIFTDKKPKRSNGDNLALGRKKNGTRSNL